MKALGYILSAALILPAASFAQQVQQADEKVAQERVQVSQAQQPAPTPPGPQGAGGLPAGIVEMAAILAVGIAAASGGGSTTTTHH